uniref:PARP catalytic domain-containing protein n=1 Tax=Dicentrarchus labrax TaxID=13489 RepID=A0A8P4GGS5_DICLA
MQYQWPEDDDFDLPTGVLRLDLPEPVSGRRYIMYHGTCRKTVKSILASGFRLSEDGMLGRGVYLSRDLDKASRYPLDHCESDKVVIKVIVDVGKVKAINYQGHPLQTTWHDDGYDTAWVPPKCGMVPSGLEEDCVWDPRRIQIIGTIHPHQVQASGGSLGYHVEASGGSPEYQWVEDDFELPAGVGRLDLPEPVSGKTYVMYHGTTRQNAQSIKASGFRQSADGMLGRGVYLSRDLEKASHYPIDHPESDRVVIKVQVNVGKVITIKRQGHPLQKTWHDHGYDTAWVPPKCGMVPSGLEENCVWDPQSNPDS